MPAIFAAANKGGGMCVAFPDVCKMPAAPSPVPTPYPNKGDFSNASKTSSKVKFAKKEAFSMKAKIDRSMGDEPGTLKGMQSQKNMDKCGPKKGTDKVKVEGSPVVRQTSPMAQNGTSANAPAGIHAKPCQNKVKVSP